MLKISIMDWSIEKRVQNLQDFLSMLYLHFNVETEQI